MVTETDPRVASGNITIQQLLREVLNKSARPQNSIEIAAILESFGWNDERAASTFGAEDVFELADQLWTMAGDGLQRETYAREKKRSLGERFRVIAQSFIRGLIFALPMAVSVAAMLTLRLSLWSYYSFNVEIATSIAIGTILSFVAVGGFTQAIARRGFFYLSQGFYNMGRRITFYLVRVGYVASALVGVCYLLTNLFYRNFTIEMMLITVLYYAFLCSNWLSITIMYILRKEFHFAAMITVGIAIVAVLFYVVGLNIILSQVIALSVLSVVDFLLADYFFREAERKEERGIAPPMPKRSVMIYTVRPYFLYGLLYFVFIFLDRVLAWSSNSQFSMPYMIWFRGDYELGLDFALLMLLLPMGLSEIVVNNLMRRLEITQKNAYSKETDSLRSKYIRAYIKSMVLIAAGAVISAVLIIWFVWFLQRTNLGDISKVYQFSSVTYFVFYVALFGYAVLSVALANAVILFSISQPGKSNWSIGIALLVDFLVGFAASRWFGYYDAVVGMAVGSVVFLILTTYQVSRVLRRLNYYIYATL